MVEAESPYVTQYTLQSVHLSLQTFIEMNNWYDSKALASATLSILEPHCSLVLLLTILLLSSVVEILQLCSSSSQMERI